MGAVPSCGFDLLNSMTGPRELIIPQSERQSVWPCCFPLRPVPDSGSSPSHLSLGRSFEGEGWYPDLTVHGLIQSPSVGY